MPLSTGRGIHLRLAIVGGDYGAGAREEDGVSVGEGVSLGVIATIAALALFLWGVSVGRGFERDDLREYCSRGWLVDKAICASAAKQ